MYKYFMSLDFPEIGSVSGIVASEQIIKNMSEIRILKEQLIQNCSEEARKVYSGKNSTTISFSLIWSDQKLLNLGSISQNDN